MPVCGPVTSTSAMPASASHTSPKNSCSVRTRAAVLGGVVAVRLHLLRLHVLGVELQDLGGLVVEPDHGMEICHGCPFVVLLPRQPEVHRRSHAALAIDGRQPSTMAVHNRRHLDTPAHEHRCRRPVRHACRHVRAGLGRGRRSPGCSCLGRRPRARWPALRRRHPGAQREPSRLPAVRAAIDAVVRAAARRAGRPVGMRARHGRRARVPPPRLRGRAHASARAAPAPTASSPSALGEPGAARAVGQALGANPFAIIVPCHRVLAAGGRSGGFSAPGGVDTKLRLLEIERARIGDQPSLFDAAS